MKVVYQREMRRNYMIIDPQEWNWEGYESRMVASNAVDGLLKIRIRQMENGVRFYYDITSKQPLSRMLNGPKWRADDFRNLLIQICGLLERIDGYLLKESRIFLDPDFIYMDPESRKLWFCMIPGMERNFPEDFGRLLEKLLECADHRDRECVVLAYGIYQETRKENYGIEDLMRLIYKKPDTQGQTPAGKIPEQKAVSENVISKSITSGELMSEERKKEIKTVPESSEGLWDKMIGRVRELFSGKQEKGWTEETAKEDVWQELISGAEIKLQERQEEQYFEGKAEAEIKSDTILLTEVREHMNNRVLRALDTGVSDIPITYYPFVIGKQENLVDYRLDDDTVSRLHLKIDCRDDQYLLQDLNSTNGTTLRGQLLENNAVEEVRTGDEVGIARYRFRFE
ncbi:MAG: FHA domain-containing protein [Clostridiales bacterium]|nr:FHA domain-containing protein [Clostridiales bacterium]